MRSRFSPILYALAAAALAPCLGASAQPGPASSFSFLRLEPSARAAAMAGSFSAVFGEDVNAMFYNPALVNEQMHGALSVSYLNHLAGVNAGFVAHARHLAGLGTVAAGLRFVRWGTLDGYDETGVETAAFRAGDAALTLSFARSDAERLHYGANLHVIRSSAGDFSASAVAADIGAAYHIPESSLTVTASANNVGLVLNDLGSSDDHLPLDLRIAVSKRLRYVPLLVSVTGYNLNHIGSDTGSAGPIGDTMRHITLGGEFQFSEAFNVRLGYNHRRHEDLKIKSRLDMAGVGLGFGINVSTISFDYAYSSWSSLGGLHQFTVRTVI